MNLYQKLQLIRNIPIPSIHKEFKPIIFDECKAILEENLMRRARQKCTTFSAVISPWTALNPGVLYLGTTGDINKDEDIAKQIVDWLKEENININLDSVINKDLDDYPPYSFYLDISWYNPYRKITENEEYENTKIGKIIKDDLKIKIQNILDDLNIEIKYKNKIIGRLDILKSDNTNIDEKIFSFCKDLINKNSKYVVDILFQEIIKELVATSMRLLTQKKITDVE